MSYSIRARGATIAAAMAAIAAEFDSVVVATQPIHLRDREAALAAAEAMTKQLDPAIPEGHDVSIQLHGSLGWRGSLGDGEVICSANVGATAHYTLAEKPAT